MSTGYTIPVEDGDISTLTEFVRSLVPNFVGNRKIIDAWKSGQSFEGKTPQDFYPYPDAEVQGIMDEIAAISNMTDEKAEKEAQQEYSVALANFNRCRDRDREQKKNLETMISKVDKWAPSAPEGLAKFAKEQLEGSLGWFVHEASPPEKRSGAEWRAHKRNRLLVRREAVTNSHNERIDSLAKVITWLVEIETSLKGF